MNKGAEILMASRVYEDHQRACDRTHNTRTIKKCARKQNNMAIWDKFGEDHVLHDANLFLIIGSFTKKTTGAKYIITSKQTLWDTNEGVRGIELMLHNPTDEVLGLHIKSNKPQPGMNAYTWVILTAVVGLLLLKFMPSVVKGHSDCMSAIIYLDNTMLAFQDTQLNVAAGVLISGGYQFRATKEDTRDITIKISDIGDPRLISWIQS
jgi:hypothetical protein